MDWLTEYFDLVLPVIFVLLYLFQRMFVREEREGETHGPELDEEARRIQEEIRRKIVARQRGEDLPPPIFEERESPAEPFFREAEAGPPPVPDSFPRTDWREVPEPSPVAVERPRNLFDELEAQKQRLREARLAKEEAVNRVKSTGRPSIRRKRETVSAGASDSRELRDQLQADLATSESLKRAFLLKEVLDRPVGLRERPDVFGNW